MKALLFLSITFLLASCMDVEHQDEVIIYTSVDQHYSEPALIAFESKTGIHVKIVFDVEASKTTGLVNRLIAEKQHPKADVFWNGEFAQTALLASHGILAKYKVSSSSHKMWHDPENRWNAFGGRARVLISNREKIKPNTLHVSIDDLIDKQFPAEKIGMALPLFGTTATHVAALWAEMGKDKTTVFFTQLKERGVFFVDGNSVVRDKVASGELWFGLTDSDDACAAAARGAPIDIHFLDQGVKEMGTLVIPNTIALISGGPNPENGKKLIDYLLTKENEEYLAQLGWFHILNGHVYTDGNCPLPDTIKIMSISQQKLVDSLIQSQNFLHKLLL